MDYKNPSESTTIHYHPLESSGVTLFSTFFPQLELEPLLGAERNAIAANIGSLFQSIGCFHGGLRRLALSSDVAIWFPMSSPDVLLLFFASCWLPVGDARMGTSFPISFLWIARKPTSSSSSLSLCDQYWPISVPT